MEKVGNIAEAGMETLLHLGLDSEGLDKDIVYPYRAVVEAMIKEEHKEWPLLKKLMASFFATQMRTYGDRNPKYSKYIKGVNELGVLAREGKKVNTIINTLTFDYQHLWVGINKIAGGRIFRNAITWEKLELYPITNFDIQLKKHYLYELFEESVPGLIKLIIKAKQMVYVTSDFNFAVDRSVLENENIHVLVSPRIHDNFILLDDGVKVYLV